MRLFHMLLRNGRGYWRYIAVILVVIFWGNVLAQEEHYLPAECPFEVPEGLTVDCGYLTVPSRRDAEGNPAPDTGELKLAVAIFRSPNPNPSPDPIVYLEGGPGGDALERIPLAFNEWFAPFLEERDFVIFDQRGTGYSQPSLACEEMNQPVDSNRSEAELRDIGMARFLACRDRLLQEGVLLEDFNSAESAADVDELRSALGYDQWNLLGISYGTRLALTVMRDHPEGVRSVILDSTYAPQINIFDDMIYNADRSFNALFDACAADSICDDNYPDLRDVFYNLVDQMNAVPIKITTRNSANDGFQETEVTGDMLIGMLFQWLYRTDVIPGLPRLIYDTHNGNYSFLTYLSAHAYPDPDSRSIGQYFSVQCHEEVGVGSGSAH